VEVSVRFGRETGRHPLSVFVGFQIVFDDGADKIGCRGRIYLRHIREVLSKKSIFPPPPRGKEEVKFA